MCKTGKTTDGEYQHKMRGRENNLGGSGEEIQSKSAVFPIRILLDQLIFNFLDPEILILIYLLFFFFFTDPGPAHSSEYHVKKFIILSLTYVYFFPLVTNSIPVYICRMRTCYQ